MRTDQSLLSASRAGDRDAFGTLVLRYQGLVSGLTFSATGDLTTSEELAQQTFVTAWRRLGELRDPGRLVGWLAGIARNLVRHHHRDTGRAADRLSASTEESADEATPSPVDLAIRDEQSRLLWSVLEQGAEPYRETMVLYYRSERSVAEVAAALGISDDAVKQRLARGRKMLRREVSRTIEDSLCDSRPGGEFSAAVLAALPGMAAGPALAAGGTKVLLAKLPVLGAWVLGPLIGVAGAVFGCVSALRSARSDEERAFLRRMIVATSLLAGGVVVGQLTLTLGFQGRSFFVPAVVSMWSVYSVLLVVLVVRANARLKEIRGRNEPSDSRGGAVAPSATAPVTVSTRALRWSLVGMLGGSSTWVLIAAALVGDWWALGLSGFVLAGVCVHGVRKAAECVAGWSQVRLNATAVMQVGVLWAAVTLWRWERWAAELDLAARVPMLLVLAIVVLFGGGLGGGLWWKSERMRREAQRCSGG